MRRIIAAAIAGAISVSALAGCASPSLEEIPTTSCRVTALEVRTQKHEDSVGVETETCGELWIGVVAFVESPLEVGSTYAMKLSGTDILSAELVERG